MIIANMNTLSLRQDKDALWENFLISERLKALQYNKSIALPFFWRTTQQQEIDYVEESNGTINGYELKWKADGRYRTRAAFKTAYDANTTVISRENFRSFLSP